MPLRIDEGIVPEQSWWSKYDVDKFLAPEKDRAVEKRKLGRKLGLVQVIKGGEEVMDVGVEMLDDEDEESDQLALFDIDIDDRMLDDEAEDEDPDLALIAEISNDGDSAEEDSADDSAENPVSEVVGKSGEKFSDDLVPTVLAHEQGGERVDTANSIAAGLVNNSSISADHDREESFRHGPQMVTINAIPGWILDKKIRGSPGRNSSLLKVLREIQ